MAIQDPIIKLQTYHSSYLFAINELWKEIAQWRMQLYLWLGLKQKASLYATWIAKITYFLLLYFYYQDKMSSRPTGIKILYASKII